MNLKAIITGLGLLFAIASKAQGNFGLGTKIGYEYRSSSYAEAGLLLYHPLEGLFDVPWGFVGANIGYTARVGGRDFVSGPKLGVEFHAVVFSMRSDFTFLTNYKRGSWQFSAEAGLSFVGFIYVMGGYNWTSLPKSSGTQPGHACLLAQIYTHWTNFSDDCFGFTKHRGWSCQLNSARVYYTNYSSEIVNRKSS